MPDNTPPNASDWPDDDSATHADPNYAPPPRRYHLESFASHEASAWILESRDGRSWMSSDQFMLRAWVESVNSAGFKPDKPPLPDGSFHAVPDSFATGTDWNRWRNRRASHVRPYVAE